MVHHTRRDDQALKRLVRMMNEESGPEVYIRQQTAVRARADSRPDFSAVACPTLVLVGDGDELTPPELSKEMAAGIKGARLRVVPTCGHLSTLERPEAVNAALVEWMRG